MLQDWMIRLKLGGGALDVEVDPTSIAGRIRDRKRWESWKAIARNRVLPKTVKAGLNRLVRVTRRFDIDDDSKFDLVSFERGETYLKMEDVWKHKEDLQNSSTYQQVLKSLEDNNIYRHKKYEVTEKSEIISMIKSCYSDLLVSLDEEGYIPGKKSSFATGGMGLAIVWRDGSLWHEVGATHRLVAARLVGLQRGFPLRIVAAHHDWLGEQGICKLSDISKLPRALERVDGVLAIQAPGSGR